MEETYELQANEVWAKGWDECIIKASHDQKIVFTPAAFLRLTEGIADLKQEHSELQDKFEMHLTVVRGFLAEMYATMIDHLDETPHKVEEVCRLLLQRAREDRETARERDDLKVRVQNLEWRPITEEDMPKVGDEVYSMPQPGCFYPDEPGTVYNPLRTEDLRTFKGWTWAPRPFTYFRPLNAPKEKTDAA